MKLDDLKNDWQKKVQATEVSDEIQETVNMLLDKVNKIDAEIKRRDRLEIGAALVLIPVWVVGLFLSASTIQSVGFVCAILSCLYIPYKMQKAKQVKPAADSSMRAHLERERKKVLQQKDMLESIVWWYLGPLGVSIAFISLGSNVNASGMPIVSAFTAFYLVAVVALYTGIYFMNKKGVNTKLKPLLENIDKQLGELNQ
jgi:FtsH-binding integral membrane protein